MITITAIIRVKQGTEAAMRQALLQVAAYARDHEPGTVDFYVTVDANEPSVFITYERFVDAAAMEAHNASAAVKQVHQVASGILEAPLILETGIEIASKR